MAGNKIKFRGHGGEDGEEAFKKKQSQIERKKERKVAEAAKRVGEQIDVDVADAKARGKRGVEAVRGKVRSDNTHIKKAEAAAGEADKKIDEQAAALGQVVESTSGTNIDELVDEFVETINLTVGGSLEDVESAYIESINKISSGRKKPIPTDGVEMQIKRDIEEHVGRGESKGYHLSQGVKNAIKKANEKIQGREAAADKKKEIGKYREEIKKFETAVEEKVFNGFSPDKLEEARGVLKSLAEYYKSKCGEGEIKPDTPKYFFVSSIDGLTKKFEKKLDDMAAGNGKRETSAKEKAPSFSDKKKISVSKEGVFVGSKVAAIKEAIMEERKRGVEKAHLTQNIQGEEKDKEAEDGFENMMEFIAEQGEIDKPAGINDNTKSLASLTEQMLSGDRQDVVETPAEKEIINAVEEEIKEMPAAEKIDLGVGMAVADATVEAKKNEFFASLYDDIKQTRFGNVGFVTQKIKNNIFSKAFGSLMDKFSAKEKNITEQGTMARFFASLSESYKKEAMDADRSIREIGAGDKKKFNNARNLFSNVMTYGRTVADIMGKTAASPFRYVMMGAMGFAKGTEAMKEARLKNLEVLSKTTIHDIDVAFDEAKKILEQAEGRGEVTAASLQRAYEMNLPEDILRRLSNKVNVAEANTLIQRIVGLDVRESVERINAQIIEINNNGKSVAEQEAAKEKIIKKYSKHLNDLDRMVAQWGTVDALAIGAKYATTAGKTVIAGLTVESLYLLTQNLPKMFDSLHDVFSGGHKAPPVLAGADRVINSGAGAHHEAPPATPSGSKGEVPPTGKASANLPIEEAPKAPAGPALKGGAALEAPKGTMAIGNRGPEGTIIDYLKTQGVSRQEAGVRAHKMFIEWMHSSDGRKFLGDKLPNMEVNDKNYLEAMRHIKEGAIEITPNGQMKIVNADIAKFVVEHQKIGGSAHVYGQNGGETPKLPQEAADITKKLEESKVEYNKAYKELRSDLRSFATDEYPRGIGNEVTVEEYLKDHGGNPNAISHKFIRDDVLKLQELEKQVAALQAQHDSAHVAPEHDYLKGKAEVETVPEGKGKISEIAPKARGQAGKGGAAAEVLEKKETMAAPEVKPVVSGIADQYQSSIEALHDSPKQARLAEIFQNPKDKEAVEKFVGKFSKKVFNGVSARILEDKSLDITFDVKNGMSDIEMVIKDGKIYVDGLGRSNWPDASMKPVLLTRESLGEALKFIKSGKALGVTDVELERIQTEMGYDMDTVGNGHEEIMLKSTPSPAGGTSGGIPTHKEIIRAPGAEDAVEGDLEDEPK